MDNNIYGKHFHNNSKEDTYRSGVTSKFESAMSFH